MVISLAVGLGAVSAPAPAQPVQDYDFDWVTIGDTNNSAFTGTHLAWPVYGRGAVSYRYRISKYEVTTAQWIEYVNTFSTQSDDNTFFACPTFWGARRDETYDGPGARFVLRETPNAANMPVFGLTWREAAECHGHVFMPMTIALAGCHPATGILSVRFRHLARGP